MTNAQASMTSQCPNPNDEWRNAVLSAFGSQLLAGRQEAGGQDTGRAMTTDHTNYTDTDGEERRTVRPSDF